jgi:hypothetical protein
VPDQQIFLLSVFERQGGRLKRTRCNDEVGLGEFALTYARDGQRRTQTFASVIEVRLRRIIDVDWPAPATDCLIRFDDGSALIIERRQNAADYAAFIIALHRSLAAASHEIDYWQRTTPAEHGRFAAIGAAVLLGAALILRSVPSTMILIAVYALFAFLQKPKRYDPAQIPPRLL